MRYTVIAYLFLCSLVQAENIYFAGDSLVATYPGTVQTKGWGQTLPDLFQSGNIFVNRARSGYSTKMFLDGTSDRVFPAQWNILLTYSPKPDYVFISFGYNDAYNGAPYWNEKYSTIAEYKQLLGTMVSDVKTLGAEPILVTAPCNRGFVAGQLDNFMRPYAEGMIEVGQTNNVGVVDLNKLLADSYQALGETQSNEMYGYHLASGAWDTVHFNQWGAEQIATMIANELPIASPSIAQFLIAPEPSSVSMLLCALFFGVYRVVFWREK